MLSAIRASAFRSSSLRTFSTSTPRQWDLAKLTLIGTLVRDPEIRTTKSDKEYAMYTVATTNFRPNFNSQDATNEERFSSTFHRVLAFQESQIRYLKSLRKGSKVYVEANYEVKEPEPGMDASEARGQRQIFLRQDMIRVINPPRRAAAESEEEPESHGSERF